MGMRNVCFIDAAAECLSNGERLIEDARWLPDDRPATRFALATIAQEEFAKAFLLFLASRNVIAWDRLIFRATRDHASKQLLGLVMNYINPAWEDFERRVEDWRVQHEEWDKLSAEYKDAIEKNKKDRIWNQIQELHKRNRDLPDSVADAINILRHEKIGRWQAANWSWDEEPVYDAIAKSLADGKLDTEKQDALYVRIGPNGGLARTPNHVKAEDAESALEMAGRFSRLIEGLLSEKDLDNVTYEKIESAFRVVFADLNQEES